MEPDQHPRGLKHPGSLFVVLLLAQTSRQFGQVFQHSDGVGKVFDTPLPICFHDLEGEVSFNFVEPFADACEVSSQQAQRTPSLLPVLASPSLLGSGLSASSEPLRICSPFASSFTPLEGVRAFKDTSCSCSLGVRYLLLDMGAQRKFSNVYLRLRSAQLHSLKKTRGQVMGKKAVPKANPSAMKQPGRERRRGERRRCWLYHYNAARILRIEKPTNCLLNDKIKYDMQVEANVEFSCRKPMKKEQFLILFRLFLSTKKIDRHATTSIIQKSITWTK